MRKLLLGIGLIITVCGIGAFLTSSVFSAPLPALLPAPSQQVAITYNKILTASIIARELGLPDGAITDFTETASECTVTHTLVLRTDTDEVYDSQGNVISSNQRAVTSLTPLQLERLDQLMRSRGCHRAQR